MIFLQHKKEGFYFLVLVAYWNLVPEDGETWKKVLMAPQI